MRADDQTGEKQRATESSWLEEDQKENSTRITKLVPIFKSSTLLLSRSCVWQCNSGTPTSSAALPPWVLVVLFLRFSSFPSLPCLNLNYSICLGFSFSRRIFHLYTSVRNLNLYTIDPPPEFQDEELQS